MRERREHSYTVLRFLADKNLIFHPNDGKYCEINDNISHNPTPSEKWKVEDLKSPTAEWVNLHVVKTL